MKQYNSELHRNLLLQYYKGELESDSTCVKMIDGKYQVGIQGETYEFSYADLLDVWLEVYPNGIPKSQVMQGTREITYMKPILNK